MKRFAPLAVIFALSFGTLVGAPLNLEQGPTKPAQSPTSETKIDPAAQPLLRQLEQAYDKLSAAELAGTVTVNVDIPSDAHKTNQQFSSTFSAPNKFKHQIKDGLLMGSDGGEVYIYNEEANSYLTMELPINKSEMRDLPVVVPQVLQSQNPSLLFAVSKNGVREVASTFSEVKRGTDLEIDGQSFPVLMFCSDEQESELHLAIDPKTHLIRRFTIDFKPALEEGGITNVRNAEVVVDYATINVKPGFAEQEFAWSPPEGAFNVREPAGAARPEKPAKNMEGVPAPNFKLSTLEGRTVSLSDLRGKVVVLDFWATWSTPSTDGLSHMGKMLDQENGELRILAVNLEEDKDRVQTYVDLKDISVPVLLDAKGEVAKSYEVTTIPQTFVIGKDGVVQKVFIGHSEDREEELQKAIQAAKQ
ncbi:MAG: redoxin domain-containing protein [Limisphaerales bacterium]